MKNREILERYMVKITNLGQLKTFIDLTQPKLGYYTAGLSTTIFNKSFIHSGSVYISGFGKELKWTSRVDDPMFNEKYEVELVGFQLMFEGGNSEGEVVIGNKAGNDTLPSKGNDLIFRNDYSPSVIDQLFVEEYLRNNSEAQVDSGGTKKYKLGGEWFDYKGKVKK